MTARGPVYDNFTDLSKFWIKRFFVQRCEYQLIQLLVRGGAACYLSVGAMWSCVSPWEISRLFDCVRWRFSLRDVKQFSSSFRQVYILDTLTGQYLALLRIRNLICWGSRAYSSVQWLQFLPAWMSWVDWADARYSPLNFGTSLKLTSSSQAARSVESCSYLQWEWLRNVLSRDVKVVRKDKMENYF